MVLLKNLWKFILELLALLVYILRYFPGPSSIWLTLAGLRLLAAGAGGLTRSGVDRRDGSQPPRLELNA